MDKIEEIKKVAINEVLNPSFELTKQYLANNQLVFKDELPFIEDIIFDKQEQKAFIYFPIYEEYFYLVVIIGFEHEVEILFISMYAGNRVKLLVVSEKNSLNTLLGKIDFVPSSQWNKGDKLGQNGKRKNSGFLYTTVNKMTGEVEDKLSELLKELHPRKNMIHQLLEIADVEIQVTYYGYKDQMWGINLGSDVIKKIADLNISIDLDLYAGGDDIGD